MRPDAYGILTACGSPHLAHKAEQVPQRLRDTGSLKRTCPLYSIKNMRQNMLRVYKAADGGTQ